MHGGVLFLVSFIFRLHSSTFFFFFKSTLIAIFVWILALAQLDELPNLGPIYKRHRLAQ